MFEYPLVPTANAGKAQQWTELFSELTSKCYTIYCLDCNDFIIRNSSNTNNKHKELVHNNSKYKLFVLYKS